jgi:hypothetical protein
MKKNFIAVILVYIALALQHLAFAATVTAGTTLVVHTNGPISTHTTAGRHFKATLDKQVGGLPAGTQITGLIETSRLNSGSRSNPLSLTLTSISANGKNVAIKTDSVQPQSAKTTRQSRGGFSVGEYTFPAGTKLEFRLSQAVNL